MARPLLNIEDGFLNNNWGLKGNLNRFRWLFCGIPVLWDYISDDELFKKYLQNHPIIPMFTISQANNSKANSPN